MHHKFSTITSIIRKCLSNIRKDGIPFFSNSLPTFFNLFLRMFGRSWLDTFGPVVVITIPIAWRVSFPSKVRMLWSTSCTTQWQNDPLIILLNQSEAFSFSIIDCLCHVTSLELKLYPSFDKSTTCHRDQNTWSFYTANLNSIDGKVDRGRIACVIHCLMLACWSEEEAHTSMNSFRFGVN